MSIIQGGGAHNVDSAGAVFDHTIGQSLRFNDNDNVLFFLFSFGLVMFCYLVSGYIFKYLLDC